MKEVFLIKSENKIKAEDALKNDDLVSRGSISLKSPDSLGLEEEGYFVIIDTSEEGIKKAEELLKPFGSKYEKKDDVLKKLQDQEDSAIQGFGNILGD
jgi:hypothetical protein